MISHKKLDTENVKPKLNVFFIGGSTTLGFGIKGPTFAEQLANSNPGITTETFAKPRLRAQDAFLYLKTNQERIKKGQIYIIQIGAGDHYPITNFRFINRHPILKLCIRKIFLARNTTNYLDYKNTINDLVQLLCGRDAHIYWIVTLYGYRFSPIERQKQQKYYKAAFTSTIEEYQNHCQVIDLNEIFSPELKYSLPDKIHLSDLGHKLLAKQISNKLEFFSVKSYE